jgi:hypothetical protein
MKLNLINSQAILLAFFSFGVCSMYADDKREPLGEDKPHPIKQGGLSSEDLWDERDVKEYLNLPYVKEEGDVGGISADDIASTLKTAQTLGKYQIGKDPEGSPELVRKPGAVSFKLREEDKVAFHVTVHGSQSWNRVFDELFKYITHTVDLWNRIPEYYKVMKGDGIYVVTRDGKNPQKWHFDLKERLVIVVYSGVPQEDAVSQENAAAQIDQVIGDLKAIIDDRK